MRTFSISCPDLIAGIVGSFSTSFSSTENPNPVPHISMNRHSENASTQFIFAKAQLYIVVLSLLAAPPAAQRNLIDGITENSVKYFLVLFIVFSGISLFSEIKKLRKRSIVSGQFSLLLSLSLHREYVLLYINSAISFLNKFTTPLRFITIGLSPYIRLFISISNCSTSCLVF